MIVLSRTVVTLVACIIIPSVFASFSTAQEAGKKYALLVGVNQYDHPKLTPLRYSENDVVELAKVLTTAGYEVTLLRGRDGAKQKIETRLASILQQAGRTDSVLVAFAGHGLQFPDQKDGFFCPVDARPFGDAIASLVSLGKIYNDMDRSFAQVKVLLVDACRNDGTRGVRGVDGDNAPRPPRGVAAYFSCAAGEVAYESEQFKHGIFFHFILEGLRGEANNKRGEVTFATLQDYVSHNVPTEVARLGGGARQSPNVKSDLQGASPVLIVGSTHSQHLVPFRRGCAHMQRQEYAQAVNALSETIELKPNFAEAYERRALISNYTARDLDRALADCNKALEISPGSVQALVIRGLISHVRGDKATLLRDANSAIDRDPRFAPAYWARAVYYYFQGDHERASTDVNEAIRLDADLSIAFDLRGLIHAAGGNPDAAIADYTQALSIDPGKTIYMQRVWAHNNRGFAYSSKQQWNQAIADFTESIRLEPTNWLTHQSRGWAWAALGQFDRAVADYTGAIRNNPGEGPSQAWQYNQRAWNHLQNKNFTQAIADTSEAIRMNPRDSVFYTNRGNAYTAQQQWSRALADYANAMKLAPNDPQNYDQRAAVYRMLNDLESAAADEATARKLKGQ